MDDAGLWQAGTESYMKMLQEGGEKVAAVIGYGLLTLLSLGSYLYLKKRRRDWKYRNYLLIGAATGVLCLLTAALDIAEDPGQESLRSLERNPAGQGAKEVQLQLEAEGLGQEYSYGVTVEEQKVTAQEAEQLLAGAKEELEREILGENPSPDEISQNLRVPALLADGAVEVNLTFEPYELVNPEGEIFWENLTEDTALVKATARLSCQDYEALHEFYLQLTLPTLTEEETVLKEVEHQLAKENERSGQSTLTLPGSAGGVSLRWFLPRENTQLKVLVLGVVLMVAWHVYGREKQDRQRKARDNQLSLDYPDIVSQLSLLTGAGMTVPAAWGKLALEYRDQRQAGRIFLRPGYEEMLKTWHEMQDGMGELAAYENFGRRCDKPQYRKFASLLAQNVRKGTRGMQQLLDMEAEEAFEQRKAHARRLGEEAGTKLLLPMGLMLVLVFAVLLVPAMLSMGV